MILFLQGSHSHDDLDRHGQKLLSILKSPRPVKIIKLLQKVLIQDLLAWLVMFFSFTHLEFHLMDQFWKLPDLLKFSLLIRDGRENDRPYMHPNFDPLLWLFPRVSICHYKSHGLSGTIEGIDAICVNNMVI